MSVHSHISAFRAILLPLVIGFAGSLSFAQEKPIPSLEEELRQLILLSRPYVVSVVAESDFHFTADAGNHNTDAATSSERVPLAVVNKRVGSGLIADADGLVLTRRSVVDGMQRLFVVTHTGDTLDAQLLGYDNDFDIALLKIAPLNIANPLYAHTESVGAGNWVMILANSFGKHPGLSLGVIRSILDNHVLRVAANIWPGSIGAPVFNLRGQVVGIVAARMARSSIAQDSRTLIPSDECVVIPISSILPRIKRIAQDALETAGWVGLSVTQYPGEKGKPVYKVTFVYENSPAALAGIRLGDQVLKFNGKPITDLRKMASNIRTLNLGETVEFEIKRGNEILVKKVKVTRRPPLYVLQQQQRRQLRKTGVEMARGREGWPSTGINRTMLIQRKIARLESELKNLKKMLKEKPPQN